MPHPFAQQFAAAEADEAEFGPVVCDGCEKHQNREDDLREVDGKFLCDDCDPNTCTCEVVDVDPPGPFGPCTTIVCASCEREEESKREPLTLAECVKRDYGLRESGGRI